MGFWDKLFGRESHGGEAAIGYDEQDVAKPVPRITDLFERAIGNDPDHCGLDARQKAANALMLANETSSAREAWLSIARDYPDVLARTLQQVAVCYHLERNFLAAIENYEAAIRVGADPELLAVHIIEARKGISALG